MRFRLLGRLELVNGNGSVVLPGVVSRAIVGRLLLDRARQAHAGLLEPLARHAVGVLLDRLDAHHRSGANARGGTDRVRDWLAGSPSVLAAFC
ncbi:hypothetical protein [Streptomyces pseudovenezuelae]|nr:hypothetical protein [Streptomyces pseudovenezuelae]